MNTLPMELPRCKQHGIMEQRDPKKATPEQNFCGVWYGCIHCTSAVLFPSRELQVQLAEMTS